MSLRIQFYDFDSEFHKAFIWYWAIPEKIHTPLWTTLNWVPKNFSISKKNSSSLRMIPNPRDSKMGLLAQTATFTTFVAHQRSR